MAVSREDIRGLVEAVQNLSLRVDHLARALESQRSSRSEDEWEEIEGPALPCGATEKELYALYAFRGAEDGPPSTPGYCLDAAIGNLRGVEPGAEKRANRAFKAGFWSKVAVETSTPYYWTEPLGLTLGHWVCLRAGERETPVRFNRKSDFNLFVAGIPEEDIVSEAFASLTEVSIYSVGAGVRLPPLKTWRKTN